VAPGHPAVANAGSEAIAFDGSWGAPEPSGLPGPADLLASAFAACLLKNVERSSQLMPFRYQGADVVVTAHRQDSPPRFSKIHYELSVITDEPARRVELMHANLRRYGTVCNTLASVCEVDGTVVAVPTASVQPSVSLLSR
jgi:uncharacterized OsmC-like protein